MTIFDIASEQISGQKCISCQVFQEIDTVLDQYARFAFDRISPSLLGLFSAFAALWIVWQIGKYWLNGEGAGLFPIFKHILLYSVLVFFLSYGDIFWDSIYWPFKDWILSAPLVILEDPDKTMIVHNNNIGFHGVIFQMLNTVDTRFRQLIHLGAAISKGQGLFMVSVSTLIASIVLQIIYFFNWIYFLILLGEALIKMALVAAVSPILIVSMGFSQTRQVVTRGLNIMFNAGLQIFLVVLMLSFSFYIIGAYEADYPVSPNGDIDLENAEGFINGSIYYFLIIIGIMTGFMMKKAQHIASYLAGGIGDLGAASSLARWATAGGLALAKGPLLMAAKKYAPQAFAGIKNMSGSSYEAVRENLRTEPSVPPQHYG